MAAPRKKNRILLVFMLFLLILAAAGVLVSLALWSSASAQRDALDAALRKSSTELSIRRLAEEQRLSLAASAQEDAELARRQRLALKESFLQRDREELALLVNPWQPLPEGYSPRLVPLGDGIFMDERAAGALTEMLRACFASGTVPVPLSGYRTQEYQQELFDKKVENLLRSGYSQDVVWDTAAQSVAVPGTSEHQLGFAIDIADLNNPDLDITQSWTDTQRWLAAHCTDCGFIVRYPEGTTDITGIIYEPWHYRYLGKSLAASVSASGLTYEEYIQQHPNP